MKHTSKLLLVLLAILVLLLAACGKEPAETGPAGGGLLVQSNENGNGDYAGYQFSGQEPWGGTLTVTVMNIADGKMDWSFVDSFEGHTLYQVQKGTALQDGTAAFDIQGKDVEQQNVSFHYQGSLELKDGKLTVTFNAGAVTDEGGAALHDAASLSSPANQAVLEKAASGPYMVYTVQSGDSVHSIGKAYGISTRDLCILNQVVIIETAKAHGYEFDDVTEYAKYLFPGEELLVPKK